MTYLSLTSQAYCRPTSIDKAERSPVWRPGACGGGAGPSRTGRTRQ
jgi:hypothetical protein